MVLHFWLIPLLILLILVIGAFYFAIKRTGGSGVRSEGRTVVDKRADEDTPPDI